MIVRGSVGIGPSGYAFAATFACIGLPVQALLLLVAGTLVLGAPFVLQRTGSRQIAGNLLAFGVAQSLLGPTWFLNGIWSAAVPWFAFPVTVAALVVGKRAALLWTLLSAAWMVALYLAWLGGTLPTPLAPPEILHPLATFTEVLFLLVVLAVGIAADSAVDRQQAILDQARLDALEASRSKSTFLAQMSHELRTPMNAVLGYTELLQEDADPATYADLARIHRAGTHLLALVNDVLDLSKVEAGQLDLRQEAVDLAELLQAVTDQTAPLLQARGNTLRMEGPTVQVRGDGLRLHQCVLNLVSNANKFTENGLLTLRISDGEMVRLDVIDTGVGMTAEQLARVFEPFVQVHDQAGGTGLGLAIVREMVRGMGGRVEATSQLGVGSTFSVFLPRAG